MNPRKKFVEGTTLSSDALEWWRRVGQYRFPNLAKVVRITLQTPASLICSEQLFSEVALVYEEKRNRLLAERGNNVIFMHHNLLTDYML